MSSSDRSAAYSASTIAVASSKRLVRWRMVAGRCMVSGGLRDHFARGMTDLSHSCPKLAPWRLGRAPRMLDSHCASSLRQLLQTGRQEAGTDARTRRHEHDGPV